MAKKDKILIVGLGLIGGSYAQGLSAKGFDVSAIDTNLDSIQYAMEQGWIMQGSTVDDPELIHEANLIISGLYPTTMVKWIKENQQFFQSHALITDVSGVKTGIVKEVQENLRNDVEFIGAHPMAGKEVSGVRYADAKIFEGANFIITPTEKNTEEAIERVRQLAVDLNFKTISLLTIEEHDRMIGFVSQLTHTIAVSLMNTNDNHDLKKYTGDSFRDLTRIANINETIWSELFLLNKDNLVKEMDEFIQTMEYLKKVIEQDEVEELKYLLIQSTTRRHYFDE
ncbi:MAG: prephenate dehydrogenase [Erysipelotrichaceae bacterium]|nr:prephenate dehydrogenase [Erysipelotrichaceae bacterium]